MASVSTYGPMALWPTQIVMARTAARDCGGERRPWAATARLRRHDNPAAEPRPLFFYIARSRWCHSIRRVGCDGDHLALFGFYRFAWGVVSIGEQYIITNM